MGVDPYVPGQELHEDRRVSANELDGANGDTEVISALGNYGNGERFRGLRFEEVLEVDDRNQELLSLDGVVKAAIADAYDGCGVAGRVSIWGLRKGMAFERGSADAFRKNRSHG